MIDYLFERFVGSLEVSLQEPQCLVGTCYDILNVGILPEVFNDGDTQILHFSFFSI